MCPIFGSRKLSRMFWWKQNYHDAKILNGHGTQDSLRLPPPLCDLHSLSLNPTHPTHHNDHRPQRKTPSASAVIHPLVPPRRPNNQNTTVFCQIVIKPQEQGLGVSIDHHGGYILIPKYSFLLSACRVNYCVVYPGKHNYMSQSRFLNERDWWIPEKAGTQERTVESTRGRQNRNRGNPIRYSRKREGAREREQKGKSEDRRGKSTKQTSYERNRFKTNMTEKESTNLGNNESNDLSELLSTGVVTQTCSPPSSGSTSKRERAKWKRYDRFLLLDSNQASRAGIGKAIKELSQRYNNIRISKYSLLLVEPDIATYNNPGKSNKSISLSHFLNGEGIIKY